MLTVPGGVAPAEAGGGDVVVFPLSFPQQRLWLIDQVEPGSPAYNLPGPLRVRGPLDAAALERALAEIVSRHESLRTRFGLVDGEPAQLVDPPRRLALPVADLAALPGPAREAEARRLSAAEARTPFDLERGPLFRARLLRLAPGEHLLLLTLHHIVSDGWSSRVLLRELSVLYRAFAAGAPSPLPELPIQYGDYAVWQREELAGEALDEQVAFWRAELEGAPPATELPVDRPHPPTRGGRSGRHLLAVSAESSLRLAALARAEGATTFMALLAACGAWLGGYADADDVVLGTPIAGRTQEELEGLIGFFVNTLAIRVDLSGDPAFRELVARVRARLLGAYAHQDLPFEKVVEELRVPRDPGAHAGLPGDVRPPGGRGGGGRTRRPRAIPPGSGSRRGPAPPSSTWRSASWSTPAGWPPAWTTTPACSMPRRSSGWAGTCSASSTPSSVDPRLRLSALPLLPTDEERRALAEWNDTRREYPPPRCTG